MDTARQQIVDSIRANSNILVTVSTDPSVDELASALGLTMLLNKLDKRATAVVSGVIPPAIDFLEPGKTFENTADSLRDFIIALDKEKADHLRYKVDGDVVKIFITPYRTTLTQNDLDFSQGDYNVELIIAIGVKDQDHLDKALAAHGKILHDATVVTITNGTDTSSLGTTDWHDAAASSFSEMMVSLTDGLKTDKPILDEQISSAYLTGIVSATDRFSNDRTSSRVMTMAAQLMAAGANQQLIAAKLEEAHDIAPKAAEQPVATTENALAESEHAATELTIDRSEKQDSDDAKDGTTPLPLETDVPAEAQAQKELEEQLAGLVSPAGPSLADIEKELKTEDLSSETPTAPDSQPEVSQPDLAPLTTVSDETMPGFEATDAPIPSAQSEANTPAVPELATDQPAPQETPGQLAPADPQTSIINEHGSFSDQPPAQTQPINSIQDNPNEGELTVDPFAMPPLPTLEPQPETPQPQPAGAASPALGTPEGAAMLGADPEPLLAPQFEPKSVVDPLPVAPEPLNVPSLPPLPPLPPLPDNGGLPPLPPPPPLPDFGQPVATPLSGAVTGDIFGDTSQTQQSEAPAPAPAAPEPGQYRIPGQG